MCSMALVHSRVGRVIFTDRMAQTGGLTAEMVSNDSGPVGLGYGLCWRKELNWQFMCWEYTRADDAPHDSGNVNHDENPKKKQKKKRDNYDDTSMFRDDNANVSSFASTHV